MRVLMQSLFEEYVVFRLKGGERFVRCFRRHNGYAVIGAERDEIDSPPASSALSRGWRPPRHAVRARYVALRECAASGCAQKWVLAR